MQEIEIQRQRIGDYTFKLIIINDNNGVFAREELRLYNKANICLLSKLTKNTIDTVDKGNNIFFQIIENYDYNMLTPVSISTHLVDASGDCLSEKMIYSKKNKDNTIEQLVEIVNNKDFMVVQVLRTYDLSGTKLIHSRITKKIEKIEENEDGTFIEYVEIYDKQGNVIDHELMLIGANNNFSY